jgi:anti-sigma-K factor RskA
MKRDEPENLDLLAAEYVLGTLVGGARRSFERRQSSDPFVARRVRAWEDRFALLALRFGWVVWQELRPREPQATALVASESGAALWRVAVAADGDHLEVETVGDVRYPDERSRELWALPGDAAPVSLGLMPASGRTRLALDDRQRAALALAANVAVSDEPAGGSPTGAPTGAVLYVAPLTRT